MDIPEHDLERTIEDPCEPIDPDVDGIELIRSTIEETLSTFEPYAEDDDQEAIYDAETLERPQSQFPRPRASIAQRIESLARALGVHLDI